MACLLITYDLNTPGQDYKALHEEIKSLGAWWHYLDSTWLVSTSSTPNQVSDRLMKKMDKNDSLLVIDVSNDSYAGWLTEKAWDWIRKHMSSAYSRY